MSNDRIEYTSTEKEILFSQVDGVCPLCAKSLTYKKNQGKPQKKYQIAHIYPLNPTAEEISLLKDEPRLSEDVNTLDNVIPLCTDCHTQFDKPRTVKEYRKLYDVKLRLIQEDKLKGTYYAYAIEEEIGSIIRTLSTNLGEEVTPLDYSVLKVDEKVNDDFDPLLKRHIKSDVADFYHYIKNSFAEIDKGSPGKFDLIAGQIKTFYLNLKMQTDNQEVIFNSMAEWLQRRAVIGTIDSCKVIIAFFIQNCEVFSNVTKQGD